MSTPSVRWFLPPPGGCLPMSYLFSVAPRSMTVESCLPFSLALRAAVGAEVWQFHVITFLAVYM